MESFTTEFIHMAISCADCLRKLNAIVLRQIQYLTASAARLLENK